MSTVPLRKRLAGSDSYGHVWPEDGAVIEVDYDHAMDLLAIPDGGFSVADQPEDTVSEPESEVSEPDGADDLSEVAPDPDPEPDASPAPAKKTAARRPAKA